MINDGVAPDLEASDSHGSLAGRANPPRVPPAGAVPASLLRLMRPRQWLKNIFVCAPLLFASQFLHPGSLLRALTATALFCVASSSSYVLNDLLDLEQDRQHPVKSRRALASNEVSPRQAKVLLGCLWALLLPGLLVSPPMMGAILGYLLLNLAYSISLKHVPVVDIFCVAGGFVLRTFAGALAIHVSLSQWMLTTTLCLTLYLAAGKRRHELATNGSGSRGVLEHYSVQLMDLYAAMAAVGALVFYGIFTIMHRPGLTATIPLAIFGIFRYWYVVERGSGDDSPTDALVADPWLVVVVVSWIGITIWVLWPS